MAMVPYVGIIQIRSRVEAVSASSQPTTVSSPPVSYTHLNGGAQGVEGTTEEDDDLAARGDGRHGHGTQGIHGGL